MVVKICLRRVVPIALCHAVVASPSKIEGEVWRNHDVLTHINRSCIELNHRMSKHSAKSLDISVTQKMRVVHWSLRP